MKGRVAWVGVPVLIGLGALHGLTQFPPAPGIAPGLVVFLVRAALQKQWPFGIAQTEVAK